MCQPPISGQWARLGRILLGVGYELETWVTLGPPLNFNGLLQLQLQPLGGCRGSALGLADPGSSWRLAICGGPDMLPRLFHLRTGNAYVLQSQIDSLWVAGLVSWQAPAKGLTSAFGPFYCLPHCARDSLLGNVAPEMQIGWLEKTLRQAEAQVPSLWTHCTSEFRAQDRNCRALQSTPQPPSEDSNPQNAYTNLHQQQGYFSGGKRCSRHFSLCRV